MQWAGSWWEVGVQWAEVSLQRVGVGGSWCANGVFGVKCAEVDV